MFKIYCLSDFKKEENNQNNLKRNLLIGAGLIGTGIALYKVKGFLRKGKLVKSHLRQNTKSSALSLDEYINKSIGSLNREGKKKDNLIKTLNRRNKLGYLNVKPNDLQNKELNELYHEQWYNNRSIKSANKELKTEPDNLEIINDVNNLKTRRKKYAKELKDKVTSLIKEGKFKKNNKLTYL